MVRFTKVSNRFRRYWKRNNCLTKNIKSILTLILFVVIFRSVAFGQGVDFRQFANDPTETWINSILNVNNSTYYEGSSTLQRLVFVGIKSTTGNVHKLRLSHEAFKGGHHAYDFITGYDQALLDFDNISGDPFTNLVVWGDNIGPEATAAMVQGLFTGGNTALATPPAAALYSTVNNAPPDNPGAKVGAYDALVGGIAKRSIQLYGNSPISNAP